MKIIDEENRQIDKHLISILDMSRDFFEITQPEEVYENGNTKKETE